MRHHFVASVPRIVSSFPIDQIDFVVCTIGVCWIDDSMFRLFDFVVSSYCFLDFAIESALVTFSVMFSDCWLLKLLDSGPNVRDDFQLVSLVQYSNELDSNEN